ncbi:hypothetical protein MOKP58_24760 [Mycobacterium avium subsp. hominissuis]
MVFIGLLRESLRGPRKAGSARSAVGNKPVAESPDNPPENGSHGRAECIDSPIAKSRERKPATGWRADQRAEIRADPDVLPHAGWTTGWTGADRVSPHPSPPGAAGGEIAR